MKIRERSDHQPKGLSHVLLDLEKNLDDSSLSVEKILHSISTQSHMILALVFSLPFMLPIPLPGLSLIFGSVISMAGIATFLGRDPWLPGFVKRQKISASILKSMIKHGLKFASIIEKFTRPRGVFFIRHPGIKRVNGIIIAICGLLLALPFPPGTNFPPAIAIISLCLATMEEDVVMLMVGFVMFIFNMIMFGLLIFLGFEGIVRVLEYFNIRF